MSLKLDLHVHTQPFGQTYMTAPQLRRFLKAKGLDGIAVTNFFNLSHAFWLKEKLPEFVIIVGQEIWTKDGHVIALNIKNKIPDSDSAERTIARIHDQGGFAVAPHPFLNLGVGKIIHTLSLDAIEVYNSALGHSLIYNYLAARLAKKRHWPMLAGSDTSDIRFIGQSFTEVLTDHKEEVFTAIRSGKVRLHKKALPIPFRFIVENFLERANVEPCSLHAAICFVCGKSMIVRLRKRFFQCIDCGKKTHTRIACCNGHYFCWGCIANRVHTTDQMSRYQNDAAEQEKIV